MVQQRSWRVLGASGTAEIVLAADFPMSGRPEAGFADLATGLGPGIQLWETVPPLDGTGRPSAYVDRWLAEVRAAGFAVTAVLGFCAGGVYAAALADGVARWQDRPTLVLFDPEKPTTTALYWQFHRVVDRFAGVLSAQERTLAQRAAQVASVEQPGFTAFAAVIAGQFQELTEVAFPRAGLEPARANELRSAFLSFVDYLVVADGLDPDEGWASAITISSADADDTVTAAENLRFAAPHLGLLRDPEVADAVAGLLTKVRAR